MKFDLENLVRDNIKKLKPYSSARDEFKGKASVHLDANENSYGSPVLFPSPADEGHEIGFNRYPDPLQWQLKFAIGKIKDVPAKNIFIGNGSDEVIDLAYRIFCEPGKDNVIICPPTYGMYEVCANINDVKVKKVPLTKDFQLNATVILEAADENTKLIFICSPNNPTGNNMKKGDIKRLVNNFSGLIIIDEAYIDFSGQTTFVQELERSPNLVVMQTLSKAWGLASLRLGLAFASESIIGLFNKVKPPYNINKASQELALQAVKDTQQVNSWIRELIDQRNFLAENISQFSFVQTVYKSDANFLLVKVKNADDLYSHLLNNKIVVRNRSREVNCENCIRITIGTRHQNLELLQTLKNYG